MPLSEVATDARRSSPAWARSSLHLALGAVVCAGVFFLGRTVWAPAKSPGKPSPALTVDEPMKSFGQVVTGQRVGLRFNLTNKDSRPIQVIGCRVSCPCLRPIGLPMTVEPGRTAPVRFEIDGSTIPQSLDLTVTLFTDLASLREIELQVKGEFVTHETSARSEEITDRLPGSRAAEPSNSSQVGTMEPR